MTSSVPSPLVYIFHSAVTSLPTYSRQ